MEDTMVVVDTMGVVMKDTVVETTEAMEEEDTIMAVEEDTLMVATVVMEDTMV